MWSGRVLSGVSVAVLAAVVVLVAVAGAAGAQQTRNVRQLSVSFSPSGACSRASATAGYEKTYSCSLDAAATFEARGSAWSNRSELDVSWSDGGGVSVSEDADRVAYDPFNPATPYSQLNSATIGCASDGTAVLSAQDDYDTDEILLRIDCVQTSPVVEITDFGGRSRVGAGAVTDYILGVAVVGVVFGVEGVGDIGVVRVGGQQRRVACFDGHDVGHGHGVGADALHCDGLRGGVRDSGLRFPAGGRDH